MLAWMRTDYLTPIEWWLPLKKVVVLLGFRIFDRFMGGSGFDVSLVSTTGP